MSTNLKTLKRKKPQKDLQITRFYGGDKRGVCIQLTSEMEDGNIGYVQLSKKDLLHIINEFLIKE